MGYKSQGRTLDFKSQVKQRLSGMLCYGQSKRAAVKDGSAFGKIFSHSTYIAYKRHSEEYAEWLQSAHPDCATVKKGKKYVCEYLCSLDKSGKYSAFTIQTKAKALGKLYGIKPGDVEYYDPPKRLRCNIKRSRFPVENDKHFSQEKNEDLIRFCRSTGLRRDELKALKGADYYQRGDAIPFSDAMSFNKALKVFADIDDFIIVKQGKGGKFRLVPILGDSAADVVRRMKTTPPATKVFATVHTHADIHSYRSEYAALVYRHYARDINDIPCDKINRGSGQKYQSGVYICRGDEKNKRLDRQAMSFASLALGHNRVTVIASSYSRYL